MLSGLVLSINCAIHSDIEYIFYFMHGFLLYSQVLLNNFQNYAYFLVVKNI